MTQTYVPVCTHVNINKYVLYYNIYIYKLDYSAKCKKTYIIEKGEREFCFIECVVFFVFFVVDP